MDTQLFDEFNNQVPLDSDDEDTDKTEVLSYNDDDLTRWNNGQSDYREIRQGSCLHKHTEECAVEQADALLDKQHKSGSAAMVFTKITQVMKAKSLFTCLLAMMMWQG